MPLKKLLFTVFFVFNISFQSLAWGQIGHYVIGQLTEWQLKPSTLKKVEQILQQESISKAGIWMDAIRSDKRYFYTRTWHYLTSIDGLYDPNLQEKSGDAYHKLMRTIALLKSGNISQEEEKDNLRILIHLVGDLHQPFHVGKPGDRGGNEKKVKFLGRTTNLHAVWDTGLIETHKMDYTEIATILHKKITPKLSHKYKKSTPAEWLKEAADLRPAIYDVPESGSIGNEYIDKYYHIVDERLTAASIRLAQILEEIYG